MKLLLAALIVTLASPAPLAQPSRPDPGVTPSTANPAVTKLTIATTICVRGWARTVRPPVRTTSRLKHRQLFALRTSD